MLRVEITGDRVRVGFEPAGAAQGGIYEMHAALLGGGLTSLVKAGENRGETLVHEFVALALVTHSLSAGAVEFALPAGTRAGVKRRALAVWVTRPHSLEAVQATGGWLE